MSISGKTMVTGIFGFPVEHSFSPAMHNAAFSYLQMDWVYVPFPVRPENIARAVDGIRGMSLAGVNVTIPHKTAVMGFLDELAPEARLIGAVNTIVNKNGVLKGFNTDAPGFVRSLRHEAGYNVRGKRVLIAGAGGAARAVSVQLALEGAKSVAFTSSVPQEIAAVQRIITANTSTGVTAVPWDEEAIAACLGNTDLFINATPLGMHPRTAEMPPVRVEALPAGALVCDLIYNPAETRLLKKARECGLATLNGLGMLLYQGVIAFELWTGAEAPVQVMREALQKAIKN